MADLDRPFVRRNYVLGVANGALFHMGWHGLLHAGIVIPPFVYLLAERAGVSDGRAKMMVGLVAALTTVGWLWPQIIFSNIIEPHARKKPFYFVSGLLRIVIFASAPLAILLWAEARPLLVYWMIAAAFFLYSSFGGIGLLPFMDIVSKSMPADMRGRFFGARAFWGGGLAIASAYIVKWILNPETGPGYPTNYAVIFSLAWILMTAGVFLFFMAREPEGRPRQVRITLMQQFRRGPKLLRRDRDFLRLLVTRVLVGCSAIAGPFYILYAQNRMHVSESAVGLFITAQVAFAGLAALLFGWIGDKFGNKALMIISSVSCTLVPVTALSARLFAGIHTPVIGRSLDVWVFCGVFALAGFTLSGTTISGLNYLLDIAPERRRPTYLGIMYTAMAPMTFMPVLGGALVEQTSYEFVFALAAGFGVLLLLSALRLREPRSEAAAATEAVIGVPFFRPVRWVAGKLTLRR